MMTNSI